MTHVLWGRGRGRPAGGAWSNRASPRRKSLKKWDVTHLHDTPPIFKYIYIYVYIHVYIFLFLHINIYIYMGDHPHPLLKNANSLVRPSLLSSPARRSLVLRTLSGSHRGARQECRCCKTARTLIFHCFCNTCRLRRMGAAQARRCCTSAVALIVQWCCECLHALTRAQCMNADAAGALGH